MGRRRNWIAGAIQHPGALTATAEKAGAVHGGKIDAGWLEEKASGSGVTAQRARLAETLKGLGSDHPVRKLAEKRAAG